LFGNYVKAEHFLLISYRRKSMLEKDIKHNVEHIVDVNELWFKELFSK
jgi:hypothetical protein